jgi:folate-binding protein YgfZ
MSGWIVDRTDRRRVRIAGPDRAKLLHNLCTQDVKGLAAGRGAEAFVTSPQGKTLGFVTVHALDDALLVRTDPGGLELALPHLQKYGIFDDATVEDVSDATCEWHAVGPGLGGLMGRLAGMPPRDLPELGVAASGDGLWIAEAPLGRPGWTWIGPVARRGEVEAAARSVGLETPEDEVREGLRIAAGVPRFGIDVTTANLPQELDRDARAISFTKGCYLGQETVARLDALGHVNKILRGLELPSGVAVAAGTPLLTGDGKPAGQLTSVGRLPDGRRVGLAIVRVASAEEGTRLGCGEGGPEAVVRRLPMATA